MIDPATALIGIGLLHVFMSVAVWAILRRREYARSFRQWSGGELLYGCGLIALPTSGAAWPGLLVIGHLALMGGYLLRGLALRRELGARRNAAAPWLVWLAASVGYLAVDRFGSAEALPWLVAVFAQCAGAAWLAWLGGVLHDRTGYRSAGVLAVAFGLFAFALSIHAAFVARFPHELGTWNPTPDSTVLFLFGLIMAPYGNLGYLGLVMEAASASELERASRLAGEHERHAQSERSFAQQAQLIEERRRLLAEREEMLAALAHEVRQPLSRVSSALDRVAAALPAAPAAAFAGEHLQRATDLLNSVGSVLENTLVEAALLGGDAPTPRHDVDIDTIVDLAIADLDPEQAARVRIQRDTATRTASMNGSLVRLSLRNLLSNALEHSPPPSPVVVRIADCDEPLALIFEVSDRGPGISEDVLPRLFTRGAHGERRGARPGHGLGLYIVRRAAEKHGGRAELVASGRDGTTIRIVVPQEIAI